MSAADAALILDALVAMAAVLVAVMIALPIVLVVVLWRDWRRYRLEVKRELRRAEEVYDAMTCLGLSFEQALSLIELEELYEHGAAR